MIRVWPCCDLSWQGFLSNRNFSCFQTSPTWPRETRPRRIRPGKYCKPFSEFFLFSQPPHSFDARWGMTALKRHVSHETSGLFLPRVSGIVSEYFPLLFRIARYIDDYFRVNSGKKSEVLLAGLVFSRISGRFHFCRCLFPGFSAIFPCCSEVVLAIGTGQPR